MNIELSKMQLIHLRNICKKGWGGYSKPSDDLEEMVKNGLLTKSAGPFVMLFIVQLMLGVVILMTSITNRNESHRWHKKIVFISI